MSKLMFVNVDGITSWFQDKNTKEKIKKYTDNENLELVILKNDNMLIVDGSEIHEYYGGHVGFDYCSDKYIIDDGYRDMLITTGYIVSGNYDMVQVMDKEEGIKVRQQLSDRVRETINDLGYTIPSKNINFEFQFEKAGFEFTVRVDTINSIVNRNQMRKINQLPFYSFNKNMDKYKTMYLYVFARKASDDAKAVDRKDIINKLIADIMANLGSDYHFHFNAVKKKVIRWEGI